MTIIRPTQLIDTAMNSSDTELQSHGGFDALAFGRLTFTGDVMLKRLPPDVFEKLQKTMRKGLPLDPAIANTVAVAMKDWAIENGCTHYCHWFQPLTGATAEKHVTRGHTRKEIAVFLVFIIQ
jgi:glutamine synthetase type III